MIQYKIGDLFTDLSTNENILIPHIVNCIGAWGAGFVVPLGRHFPKAREEYLSSFDDNRTSAERLGNCQFVKVQDSPEIIICNMFGQEGVGFHNGKPPIRYDALEKAMIAVSLFSNYYVIRAPFFGTGLAGGSKEKIIELIEKHWSNFDVMIYSL